MNQLQSCPDVFAVALTRLVQSEPRMRVGDTLFMQPVDGIAESVEIDYLPVIARTASGWEFFTEYDRETFQRNGWEVVAYTVEWVPKARTEILAVMHLKPRQPRAEQGAV